MLFQVFRAAGLNSFHDGCAWLSSPDRLSKDDRFRFAMRSIKVHGSGVIVPGAFPRVRHSADDDNDGDSTDVYLILTEGWA